MTQRTVALINDVSEADVARLMVRVVEERLVETEHLLTHNKLEREAYLETLSRANVLRETGRQLSDIYRRAFER